VPLRDPDFRTDIERMLIYHSWSRGKYLDLFERLPRTVLTRKRGSTFESIWNVQLHVMGVYCTWLYHYFRQKQLKWIISLPESKVRSIRQLRRINRSIDRAVQSVAKKLGPEDFDRRRPDFEGSPRKQRLVTPREVLWHLIEEDFLHTGEILCMLWQDDIEPPYTGVWWFEFDHDPKHFGHLRYSDPKYRPGIGGYVDPRRAPPQSAVSRMWTKTGGRVRLRPPPS
jgi:uncharacterized damage-inducible protein DinB